MKVVQTRLTSVEYSMLRRYAESRGLSIAEALREMVRERVLEDRVYADDPLFTEAASVRGRGVPEKTSSEHDRVLYGVER